MRQIDLTGMAEGALSSGAGLSKHGLIASACSRETQSGKYKVGDLLFSEPELSRQRRAPLRADRAALDAPPHSPGLEITRSYVGRNARVLEVARSVHPSEHFKYSMRLELRHGSPA